MRKLNKGALFPKDNISGDMKMMRDRIITPIPLLSFIIAKKTTNPGSRLKFIVHRLKKMKQVELKKRKW